MKYLISFLTLCLLAACDYANAWTPLTTDKMHIQYAGTLNMATTSNVYNVDLEDTTKAKITTLKNSGKAVICYFSAGSSEDWRSDFSKFPASVKGNRLDGWDGENWLDVRQLNVLMPIMKARMDLAVSKGCDAIDPDNVDGYTNNTGFPLTYSHQLAYNIALANAAHARGLKISLKNNMDQVPDLINYSDFAVNEQCFQYNECNTLNPFITAGKPVFNIEYQGEITTLCSKAKKLGLSLIHI